MLIIAVVAVAVGGIHLGAAVVARHRAQSAADLAALAAAARVPAGEAAACGTAEVVSTAMGASLRDCRLERLDIVLSVTVTVTATGTTPRARAHASARAGPLG